MEQVLVNLQSPSWWFTGMFFILAGVLITQLISNWIPAYIKGLGRSKRKALLKVIKRSRQHPSKVIFSTVRYWCLAGVTILYFFLTILFYVLSPKEIWQNNYVVFGSLATVYLLLFLVNKERTFIDELIKQHIKWQRITK